MCRASARHLGDDGKQASGSNIQSARGGGGGWQGIGRQQQMRTDCQCHGENSGGAQGSPL